MYMVYRNTEMVEDLSVPESLRIYNIKVDTTKVLGRGSYGIVYEACYHGANVAVKKLHPIFFEDVSKDENIGILKSWKNELQLMSTILHPNIVQFYGVYNQEDQESLILSGNSFIVSELMHKSLRARNLEKPKLNYANIINILHNIAAGLCYLHVRHSPIMHRDLASKNILLTMSGQAKIADLGVAKIVSQKKESLTRHPGTDAYMPVEAIAFDNAYDCSIDIYALGVIGLELGISRDPKATWCLKKVGENYVPVEEKERRKTDFADLESSSNVNLKQFILKCLENMELRITATTALKLLEDQKESSHYKSVEEKSCVMARNNMEDLELLSQLKKEKEDLEEQVAKWKRYSEEKKMALYEVESSHKQEMDKVKREVENYKKHLHEKEIQLEKLIQKESSSKKQIDSSSSYISRDPPVVPSQPKHYNYNSILKSQLSVSSHGSLVIPNDRSAISRRPTFGSYHGHPAKPRPTSTIVTGTSYSTDHRFLTQRSRSEDDCLSSETKRSSPLAGGTISSMPLTVQNATQSLTQYSVQMDDFFNKLEKANSAGEMGSYMKALKNIMEESQNYITRIPLHIKECSEVAALVTKLEKKISLLRENDLHLIPYDDTDRLSHKGRILLSQLPYIHATDYM